MSLIRIILLIILGYFVYLGVKHVLGMFSGRQGSFINKGANKEKQRIKKEDIIEADFEELESDNSKK